jgi:uncharacterized protein YqeY
VLFLTLKERLMNDYKEALKSRDEIRKNTINLARAAIKQVEVDTRQELQDEDIIPILAKQVKMRRDAIGEFERGNRTDLVDAYKTEIEVLQTYLPAELTEAQIREIVKTTAAEIGIEGGRQNMGKLMGATMPKVKGVADGGVVKKIIEEFLG